MHEVGQPLTFRSPTLEDVDLLLRLESLPGLSGPGERERVRERVGRGPNLVDDGFFELCVVADGEVVGAVQARAPQGAFPPLVCELGITLLPEARGRGLGRAAVRAFTEQLLVEGWARVQASTACENMAMRRVLEQAGFALEGVLRSYAPGEDTRKGTREDYAMYAKTSQPG